MFLLIQTLPAFWATRILILICLYVLCVFFIPNFQMSRFRFSDFQVPRFPKFQIPRFPDAADAGGRTLRSQPDPSPNAPRDQIRRKDPCCDHASHLPDTKIWCQDSENNSTNGPTSESFSGCYSIWHGMTRTNYDPDFYCAAWFWQGPTWHVKP